LSPAACSGRGAGFQLGDDVIERDIVERADQAHHLAERVAEVDIPSLDRPGVGVDEFIRRIGRIGGDLQR